MSRRRPAYLERKLDYTIARQRHIRTEPDCPGCPYCRTQEQIDALIRERIRLERLLVGEPPF